MNEITLHRIIDKITLLCEPFKGYYYIGQHTTTDLNDGYAGSGAALYKYYKEFGKVLNVTYKFEIINSKAKNQTQLDELEKKYIGNKWLRDQKCINLCEGGLKHETNKRHVHIVNLGTGTLTPDEDNFVIGENKEKKQIIEDIRNVNKIKNKYEREIKIIEITNKLMKYGTTYSLYISGAPWTFLE